MNLQATHSSVQHLLLFCEIHTEVASVIRQSGQPRTLKCMLDSSVGQGMSMVLVRTMLLSVFLCILNVSDSALPLFLLP